LFRSLDNVNDVFSIDIFGAIKMPKIKCYIFTLFFIMIRIHVIDILNKLFITIFDGLDENCKELQYAIDHQYLFEPL